MMLNPLRLGIQIKKNCNNTLVWLFDAHFFFIRSIFVGFGRLVRRGVCHIRAVAHPRAWATAALISFGDLYDLMINLSVVVGPVSGV